MFNSFGGKGSWKVCLHNKSSFFPFLFLLKKIFKMYILLSCNPVYLFCATSSTQKSRICQILRYALHSCALRCTALFYKGRAFNQLLLARLQSLCSSPIFAYSTGNRQPLPITWFGPQKLFRGRKPLETLLPLHTTLNLVWLISSLLFRRP